MISYHQLFRHERSWAMRRCCFRNQPHLLNRWSTIPTWTTWWCQKIWNPSPSDDHSFSHCLMVIQSGIPEKINDWSLKETHSNVDSMFKLTKIADHKIIHSNVDEMWYFPCHHRCRPRPFPRLHPSNTSRERMATTTMASTARMLLQAVTVKVTSTPMVQ